MFDVVVDFAGDVAFRTTPDPAFLVWLISHAKQAGSASSNWRSAPVFDISWRETLTWWRTHQMLAAQMSAHSSKVPDHHPQDAPNR